MVNKPTWSFKVVRSLYLVSAGGQLSPTDEVRVPSDPALKAWRFGDGSVLLLYSSGENEKIAEIDVAYR